MSLPEAGIKTYENMFSSQPENAVLVAARKLPLSLWEMFKRKLSSSPGSQCKGSGDLVIISLAHYSISRLQSLQNIGTIPKYLQR